MAKQLTQIALDRIKPRAVRFEVPDSIVIGLYLIVQPSGARSWAIRYRAPQDRKSAKHTLGSAGALDLKAARALARQELARIAGGEDPRARKRREAAATLGAIVALYDRHVVASRRPRTQVEIRRHFEKDWQPLHGRPLAELTRREIAARLLELKDASGGVAANRARASLSALFTWAIQQGLADVNPVTGTAKTEERPRERVLSMAELREIWAASAEPGTSNAIVRLLMLTLQRKSEVGGMRWPGLDLDKALWSLPGARTKNGRAHAVPLAPQAIEIIQGQPQLGDDHVFGGRAPFGGWSRAKRRLDARILEARLEVDRKAEPMPHWTFHDLRRSAATHVAEDDLADPHVVEALLNHVSGHKGGVAGIYNRAQYVKKTAAAAQAWADFVLGVTAANVANLHKKAS